MFIALPSFLGLVMCFFWNDIIATVACIKGERWKHHTGELDLVFPS
ncbi:hypothetical protein SLEP1_g58159 [Rubroshorea leprosula]|uniref:Uncharacterized protein n=1 Tax=Rubroshorea leprosula TaxID=152421 RepID=A0AAV5MPI2_9ROSI|nr:hypothetical protein SLEP1_g58159 [Rubroshorea leprosula]